MTQLKPALVVLAAIASLGGSPAEDPSLGSSIAVAVAAVPGWVLAAEPIAVDGRSALRVLIATEKDEVHVVLVESGAVTSHNPWEEGRGRALAADVRAECGDARPDLAELVQRVEEMAEGCKVAEVELERHGDSVVAEVECVRGTVEVELAFDPRDGRLLGLEDEVEDEIDGEDEDEPEPEPEVEAAVD